jgi:phosphoribosyl-AMP cyclohydrolase
MSSTDLPLVSPAGRAFDALAWDVRGLVPVVAVEHLTGTVLMAANANRCALAETLRTGWATYWSRSRNALWVKGATSGNQQRIFEVRTDCDGDHLLYVVEASGHACHTGRRSCFSWRIASDASITCDRPVLGKADEADGVSSVDRIEHP